MDTFIVRLWRPGHTGPAAPPPPQLAGEVTHVTSGTTARFGTTEQFLGLLQELRVTGPITPAGSCSGVGVRNASDVGELRGAADILGHSPDMLMRVYALTLPESIRSVTEKIGRRGGASKG